MLVNRNAINTSILHSTLDEEVCRLRKVCSQPNILSVQQALKVAQKEFDQHQLKHSKKKQASYENQSRLAAFSRELIQTRKAQDERLSAMVKDNWNLLSQLHKIRGSLREKQYRRTIEENIGKDLEKDYIKKQQRIKTIQLKSEDIYETLKNHYLDAALHKVQKNAATENINKLTIEIEIQKLMRKNILSATEELNKQANLLRNTVIQVVNEVACEKDSFIQQKEAYASEQANLIQEKSQRTQSTAEMQTSLSRAQQKEQEIFNEVQHLQEASKQIERQIVETMNLGQSVESSMFDTKVARTAAKSQKTTLNNRIRRLIELKQQLISLISSY